MKNLVRLFATAGWAMGWLAFGFFLLAAPGAAQATCSANNPTLLAYAQPSTAELTKPLDSYQAGDPLTGWVVDFTFPGPFTCTANDIKSSIATANVLSGAPVNTFTDESGIQYPVYPAIGSTEIGFVVGIRDLNAAAFTPVGPNMPALYDGSLVKNVGFEVRVRYIATARLTLTKYTINQSTAAKLEIRDASDGTLASALLNIATMTLLYTSPTCTLTGETNPTVKLPDVAVADFNGIGSTPSKLSSSFSIELHCVTATAIYATMTDSSSPSNTSQNLNLASGSTATGVGLRLYKNEQADQVVSYGPDSSTLGNTNQWLFGSAPAGGGNVSLSFTAGYVQTANQVTPGSVRAVSTITFAYQ